MTPNTYLGGNINHQQYQQIQSAVSPYGVNIPQSDVLGSVFNNVPNFNTRMLQILSYINRNILFFVIILYPFS